LLPKIIENQLYAGAEFTQIHASCRSTWSYKNDRAPVREGWIIASTYAKTEKWAWLLEDHRRAGGAPVD
jgi:hypothetical protein